jgi:hypothetical protein
LLNELEAWLKEVMPSEPTDEVLARQYSIWVREQGRTIGLDDEILNAYDEANPAFMSASSLQRYWRKVVLGL